MIELTKLQLASKIVELFAAEWFEVPAGWSGCELELDIAEFILEVVEGRIESKEEDVSISILEEWLSGFIVEPADDIATNYNQWNTIKIQY